MLDYNAMYNDEDRVVKLKIIIDGTELDRQYLKNVTIDEIFNSDDNLRFGTFCTNTFSLEMFKNDIQLEEKSKVEVIMYTEDLKETPIGVFFISSLEYSARSIKMSGYDYSAILTNQYIPTVSFPAKIKDILDDLCEQHNITLSKRNIIPDIEVAGFIEDKEIDTKMIIGYLAGLMGKNARMDAYGQLIFNWYTDSQKKITRKSQYLDGLLKTGEDVVVHSITCVVGDQQISSGEGFGITIENPFMTQVILDNILKGLAGFTYTPCTLEFRGNPSFELGDIVSVETQVEQYINVLISKRDSKMSGGLRSTITSIGLNDLTASVNKSPTEIKMKKLYNILQGSFKESTETILGHNGGYFTIDTDSDGKPTGWSIMDTPILNEATHLWKMTMGGFAFSENGGKTFTNVAIDMNGNISGNALSIGVIQGQFFDIDLNNGTIKMGKRDEYGEIVDPDFHIDHNGVVIFNAIKELEKKIENIETNSVSIDISATKNATLNTKNDLINLKAKVVLDGKDITESLIDLNFKWHRVSGNKEDDTEWDKKQESKKEILVSYGDVDLYANFYCLVSTVYGQFVSNYLPITDETDISNLQVYISSNQPTYQEFKDELYSPDWRTSGNLVLMPVVLDNYKQVPLVDCDIVWRKTIGDLNDDEVVTDGILTVINNKLSVDEPTVSYVVSVRYHNSSVSVPITFNSCNDQAEVVMDGVTYYTWVYFADNTNGDGITQNSKDKRYIGVANMQTKKEPPYEYIDGVKVYTDLSAFNWLKMVDFNSILVQSGAPNDINVLWMDQNTGQLKRYYQFLKGWAPINSETPIRDNAESVYVTTEKSNRSNFTILSNSIAGTVKSVEKVSSELGSQLEELSTDFKQTNETVQITVSQINEFAKELEGAVTKNEFNTYFTFEDDGLCISKNQNGFKMKLSNDELAFFDGDVKVAYISNKRLYIEQVVVVQSLQVGDYLLRYDSTVGFIIQ